VSRWLIGDPYRRLGWREIERLDYRGRERTVMDHDVAAASSDPAGARS
jgi:hypothetical protein